MPSYLVVLSGGMDSTTLLYMLKDVGEVQAVSFDYGQRHRIELECAKNIARIADVKHRVIDITNVGKAIAGHSALLAGDKNIEVPHGHYAADNMAITVVPNRNMIMSSIAAGVAVAEGLDCIALAVHAGDHAVYPDCRPEFVRALDAAIRAATDDAVGVVAPFIQKSKAEIVAIGERFHVPWAETQTCYEGTRIACGRCGTCVERIEAFDLNGVEDPLPYREGGKEYARDIVRE